MAEGGYDEKTKLIDYPEPDDYDDDDYNNPKSMEMRETSTSRFPKYLPRFEPNKDKSEAPYFMNPRLKSKEIMQEEIRGEVKKYYPRMSDSVEVSQQDGKLSVRIYGDDDWVKFRTKDGKERIFKKELKDALGPTAEEVRNKIREDVKNIYPQISDSVEVIQLQNGKFKAKIFGEKKWSDLETKTGEINKRINKKLKYALGPSVKESIYENKKKLI